MDVKLPQLVAMVQAAGTEALRIEIVARPDGYAIRYATLTSQGALLTARGQERSFAHIETAIGVLRRLGMTTATLDFSGWRPRRWQPGYLDD